MDWALKPDRQVSIPIVFVVDEVRMCRDLVSDAASNLGYESRQFDRAEELLESGELRPWTPDHPQYYLSDARPICIVLEARLPGINGFQLQKQLCEMRMHVPTVFMSDGISIHEAVQAAKRGAECFLKKPLHEASLVKALEAAVVQSASSRSQELACRRTRSQLATLTDRETEVLDRILARMPVKKIASELGTSPHTVRNQRSSILRKLDARDDADLVRVMLLLHFHEGQLQVS